MGRNRTPPEDAHWRGSLFYGVPMSDEPPAPIDPSDDPASPLYADPSLPRFRVPSGMIVDPVPPTPAPGARPQMCCPHCGTVLSVGTERSDGQGRRAQAGDAAVCANCTGLLVATDTSWRAPTYDEASLWDFDARVVAMRRIWGKPMPDGTP